MRIPVSSRNAPRVRPRGFRRTGRRIRRRCRRRAGDQPAQLLPGLGADRAAGRQRLGRSACERVGEGPAGGPDRAVGAGVVREGRLLIIQGGEQRLEGAVEALPRLGRPRPRSPVGGWGILYAGRRALVAARSAFGGRPHSRSGDRRRRRPRCAAGAHVGRPVLLVLRCLERAAAAVRTIAIAVRPARGSRSLRRPNAAPPGAPACSSAASTASTRSCVWSPKRKLGARRTDDRSDRYPSAVPCACCWAKAQARSTRRSSSACLWNAPDRPTSRGCPFSRFAPSSL
jgi:hypothetical protein